VLGTELGTFFQVVRRGVVYQEVVHGLTDEQPAR
jgi:hypothetical protein